MSLLWRMAHRSLEFRHFPPDEDFSEHQIEMYEKGDYRGRVSVDPETQVVEYIEVPEEHRRQGYATRLMEETRKHFPRAHPGRMTDLGEKFFGGAS